MKVKGKAFTPKSIILLTMLFVLTALGCVLLAPEQQTHAAVGTSYYEPEPNFFLQKVNDAGEPLEGASFSMECYRDDGLVDGRNLYAAPGGVHSVYAGLGWSITPYEVKMKITETNVPEGYEAIAPFTLVVGWTIDQNGKPKAYVKDLPAFVTLSEISLHDPDAVYDPDAWGPNGVKKVKFTVKNELVKHDIAISKVSDEDGTALAGAKLEITGTNANGTKIDPIRITSKAKVVTVKLPAGDYTLTEKKAPDGYEVADPITFTVDADGGITVDGEAVSQVVMSDEKDATEDDDVDKASDSNSASGKSGRSGSPDTGDMGMEGLWIVLCVAACTGLIAVRRKKVR